MRLWSFKSSETSNRPEKGDFLLEGLELIFVYNADSGIFHAVGDYFQKIVAPPTYPCKLCAITYGMGGMKRDWKKFIESRNLPVKFLHKDKFAEQYPDKKEAFPCAFLKKGDELELFISAGEINRTEDLEELKALPQNFPQPCMRESFSLTPCPFLSIWTPGSTGTGSSWFWPLSRCFPTSCSAGASKGPVCKKSPLPEKKDPYGHAARVSGLPGRSFALKEVQEAVANLKFVYSPSNE